MHDTVMHEDLSVADIPGEVRQAERLSDGDPTQSFYVYNARTGRSRFVPSFNDSLDREVNIRLSNIGSADRTQLTAEAQAAYSEFCLTHGTAIAQLAERMKYLGIADNVDISGDGGDVLVGLLKAIKFGRSKNITHDSSPTRHVLHRLQVGANITLDSPSVPGLDPETQKLIAEIAHSPVAQEYLARHEADSEGRNIIEWALRQAVVRSALPREAVVPVREIDMGTLVKERSVGKGEMGVDFQASNPLSIWTDPKTGRRFFVKECPDQTLQADYFGLEMLQLSDVPVYEFYTGFIPGEDGKPRRVLVTGFLEGYQDPAELLDGDTDVGIRKFRLPEEYIGHPDIKRGMLAEVLIGEYNSRAHNFMVSGNSVMHLDQGGCLSSTASGKFKGFPAEIGIGDIEEVISCYTDWDFNQREATNEAYAQVAEVENGQLVIHDIDTASRLLRQLESIPQERIDEALERAGYTDGQTSISRMETWIERIDRELLPQYEAKLAANPSARMEQYIRWAQSARETFQAAIQMGGELSYYKYALRQRKISLSRLWSGAIDDAKARQAEETLRRGDFSSQNQDLQQAA